ncbi:unnamed protein product [Eretmochelys imbricata]
MAVGSQKDARVSSLSLAGCWAVTGPGAVRGPPGGSVAVRCRYRGGSEDDPKFWCREAGGWVGGSWRCSRGRHIVETNGSEAEVRRGRVSIRDSHTELAFTVTVENLTRADAGTYHCGVGKVWRSDPRAAVELTVSTAVSYANQTETTPQGTKQPDVSSSTKAESSFSPTTHTIPTHTTPTRIPTHHHLFPAPGLIEGSPPPVHRLCADLDERTLQEESQGDGARQTDKLASEMAQTSRSITDAEYFQW